MALTPEMKRIYSSAPANRPLYTALVLTNPGWANPLYLIDNTIEPRTFQFDGVDHEFQPSVFQVDLPDQDSTSMPELALSFANFGDALVELCEQALASNAPIRLQLTQYSDDSNAPGYWPPIDLQMDSISLTEENCTGRARRIDFINKGFPGELFTLDNYPGLYR